MNAPLPDAIPEVTSELRRAQDSDLPAIKTLLEACALPTADLTPALIGRFCLAEQAGQMVGVVGLENLDGHGLIRSLAVAPAQRGLGLAARLVDWCAQEGRQSGIDALYLLTTTAADYFRARGYVDTPRTDVPPAVAAHPQFTGLCPCSATCLSLRLD